MKVLGKSSGDPATCKPHSSEPSSHVSLSRRRGHNHSFLSSKWDQSLHPNQSLRRSYYHCCFGGANISFSLCRVPVLLPNRPSLGTFIRKHNYLIGTRKQGKMLLMMISYIFIFYCKKKSLVLPDLCRAITITHGHRVVFRQCNSVMEIWPGVFIFCNGYYIKLVFNKEGNTHYYQ